MTRVGSLFRKSLILGIKDVFVLLELGFSVVIVALLLFVVPEDIKREAVVYVFDETRLVEGFIAQNIGLEEMEERSGEFYVDSRDELIAGMTEDKAAIGLIISADSGGMFNVELLTQPYTTEALIRYIDIDLEDLIALIAPPYDFYPPDVLASVRVEALQRGLRDELPFNQRLVPVVLMFMVGILGLFIMISLIGQERSEATLRAFLISPGRLWEFLLSKHLVLLLLGTCTFSIIYLPMMGLAGYLPSLAIILLTIIAGSAIGTFLGGIFETPMNAMLWVLLLMIVLGLPAVSLFSPTFSPGWLRIIPTYYTLFGLDAAMFPDNNGQVIWHGVAVLGGLDIVLVTASFATFGALVRKEA